MALTGLAHNMSNHFNMVPDPERMRQLTKDLHDKIRQGGPIEIIADIVKQRGFDINLQLDTGATVLHTAIVTGP